MLTKLALRGRFITLSLMILIIVGGIYSLTKIRIELFPDIDFPVVTISVFDPDASSQDILDQVSIPIEDVLSNVDDITTIQTVSAPGLSQVIIQTEYGVDMSAFEREITDRLNPLSFPSGVVPRIARVSPNEFPIIEMAIIGDVDIRSLVAIVEAQIVPGLEAIPGVFSASIPLGIEDGISIARANGRPAVTLSILKDPDANTIEVSREVEKSLDEMRVTLPSDIEFIEISNQAPEIQSSIDDLTQHILLGSVFAVMVIFAFLLSVRPTIISSISIPVSVLVALSVMQIQGMSLNILTLGGLAIAVGRVVDDSIVVIENIYRHIQLGETRRDAALNGAREVALPITVATLTTVAVFAPLALIGGFIGIIFQPFALVVTYSLLASLVVALTIVPVLSVMFISGARERSENIVDRIYKRLLRVALGRRWQTLLIASTLTVIGVALLPYIPVNFIGSADTGTLNIRITVPDAEDPQDVLDQLDAVEAVIRTMRDEGTVVAYSSNYGGSMAFGSIVSANSANLQVRLADDVDTDLTAETLRETLRETGRQVTVSTVDAGGPGSDILELTLRGNDYESLLQSANSYVELLSELDGLINISHNGPGIGVQNALSELVPIIRVDNVRAIIITGAIVSDNKGAVNADIKQLERDNPLPDGIELNTGGVFQDIDEAFQQMAIAMGISVVLVYLILVLSQRSLIVPFVIVLAMPLALFGAFGALFITQRALGLPALLGLLMLIGLVITNAIVLIAFIEQLRARGMVMRDALIEGGRTRLRPILMTAFTTTFVMIPMALNLGTEGGGIIGAELATVVIGGILTSTFLTLIVLPVIYSILRKKGPKVIVPVHESLSTG